MAGKKKFVAIGLGVSLMSIPFGAVALRLKNQGEGLCGTVQYEISRWESLEESLSALNDEDSTPPNPLLREFPKLTHNEIEERLSRSFEPIGLTIAAIEAQRPQTPAINPAFIPLLATDRSAFDEYSPVKSDVFVIYPLSVRVQNEGEQDIQEALESWLQEGEQLKFLKIQAIEVLDSGREAQVNFLVGEVPKASILPRSYPELADKLENFHRWEGRNRLMPESLTQKGCAEEGVEQLYRVRERVTSQGAAGLAGLERDDLRKWTELATQSAVEFMENPSP